jgi:hypothetical protein
MIEKKEKERKRRRAGSVLNVYNISSIFSRRFLVCICSSFIFFFFSFFPFSSWRRPGSLNTPERSSFFSLYFTVYGVGGWSLLCETGIVNEPLFLVSPVTIPFFFIFFDFVVLSFSPLNPGNLLLTPTQHTHKQLSL